MNSRKYILAAIFCILGIIFAVVVGVVLVQSKKEKALQMRAVELQRSAIAAMRLKPALEDMQRSLAKAGSTLPDSYSSKHAETEMFRALDNIKKTFSGSELRVSDFETANNIISMPVSIKVYVNDYAAFAEKISRLQSFAFPFFSLSNLNLTRSRDDGSVLAEVSGKLWFPAKQQAQQEVKK